MKIKAFLLVFLFISGLCLAQDEENADKPVTDRKVKGFHLGVYTGTLFANKYTASLYDGYGWNWDGKKNDFEHSFIYNKVWMEYGAHGAFAGQTDRIALALGVQHTDWSFDESDMPLPNSLKYNIAFMVGLNTRYCFNKKSSIIANFNATRLTVNGNFQITLQPISAQTGQPGAINYRTFSILGGELREILQVGYQSVEGDDEKLNFFWEIGPLITLSKFERNEILINSLRIPLTSFYNPYGVLQYNARNLTGIGYGAFLGGGFNITLGTKWTVQLLYTASYENIKLLQDSKLKLQHNAGVRAYYNF